MKATHSGPKDLATHSNPQPSSDMPDATDMAGDYIDVTSEAASILAGDVVASQAFDMLDKEVLRKELSNHPKVRKGINILGPGAIGVAVFSFADNDILKGIAIGHGLTTVRRAVEEGLDYLAASENGGSETSGRLPPSSPSLKGRRLAAPGMNAAATASGAGQEGQTIVEGG
jgi:hypothetical protein